MSSSTVRSNPPRSCVVTRAASGVPERRRLSTRTSAPTPTISPRQFAEPTLSTSTRHHLAGFTLVEVIVALAVILILAAVALPNVTGFLDQKRIDATVTQLATVRDALFNPAAGNNAFYQQVTKNAGRLSELDSVIIAANVYSDNSCGATFNNGDRTAWLSKGPFMTYNSEHFTGMMTPIGMAEDTLTRDVSYNPAKNRITFLNASLADAQLLDAAVENDGFNAGIVRWTPLNGVNGLVTLYYFVQINNVC
jgi:prepilin-type N-terminal cleavage/methylation domain-containing protein